MNNGNRSSHDVTQALCPACGLCCDGSIFADVALQTADDAARLRNLGLPLREARSAARPLRLPQPCAAFDGCRCRVYTDRPQYCRDFECALFKRVKAGTTDIPVALRLIRSARDLADNVRALLRGLGDGDEHFPLASRFRRTNLRLQQRELDAETAASFGELTLAMHNLNLVLGDSFYPGDAPQDRKRRHGRVPAAVACAALAVFALAAPLRADQVELGNGDRYVGHVLSVSSNTVILQSEVLGTIRLPRSKVAIIAFGRFASTNAPAPPSLTNAQASALAGTSSNAVTSIHPALRQLGVSTNLIRQVQQQFLSGAGDGANAKFNELLSGLMTGKLNVDDIRAQAKSAADQLRALQKESGEEAGLAASAYLSILDHFLKETAPTSANSKAPAQPPASKAAPAENEE